MSILKSLRYLKKKKKKKERERANDPVYKNKDIWSR